MHTRVARVGSFLALVLASAFSTGSLRAETLLDEDFSGGDGGFTVVNTGAVEKPWVFGVDSWSVGGSENVGSPTSSALVTPELTATAGGAATLTLSHRYSFERDTVVWDGGQVQMSLNGGPFTAVTAFTSNGYGPAVEGNNVLLGTPAFVGDSPGYDAGTFITSVADLGTLSAGDTVQLQFLGAWDEFARGKDPNWVIDTVSVTAVPEPGTIALGLIGLAAAGLFARRRS